MPVDWTGLYCTRNHKEIITLREILENAIFEVANFISRMLLELWLCLFGVSIFSCLDFRDWW